MIELMLSRLLLLVVVLSIAGCGTNSTPAVKDDAAALTDANKALIEKQKLCLVADEPLGSMGTPIKVNVKGRDVFLCCEGCREAVLKDPDKYLAKLDANGTAIVSQEAGKDAAAPMPPAGEAPAGEAPKAP
jgi:hypothetical protein